MRAPAFPSRYYREQGMKPVYWGGLVLWLTPIQYRKVRAVGDGIGICDATDDQIARQDEWYERAVAEQEQEDDEFARLFRSMRDRA